MSLTAFDRDCSYNGMEHVFTHEDGISCVHEVPILNFV